MERKLRLLATKCLKTSLSLLTFRPLRIRLIWATLLDELLALSIVFAVCSRRVNKLARHEQILFDCSATENLLNTVLALLGSFHNNIHALLESVVLVYERALKHVWVATREDARTIAV
jgi:hypothetical protein